MASPNNPTYKFITNFWDYPGFIRCWERAKKVFPNCRPGQAFWNFWGKDTHSFPELFYEKNEDKAKSIAWEHNWSNIQLDDVA